MQLQKVTECQIEPISESLKPQ